MEAGRKTPNKIIIRLDAPSNTFISDAINEWINLLTPLKVVERIVRTYKATPIADRRRWTVNSKAAMDKWIQQENNENLNRHMMGKTLLDTYIYYSFCNLRETPGARCWIAPERQLTVFLTRKHSDAKSII